MTARFTLRVVSVADRAWRGTGDCLRKVGRGGARLGPGLMIPAVASVNWKFRARRYRVGHELILIRAVVGPADGHLAAGNARVSLLAALVGQTSLADHDLRAPNRVLAVP